MTLEELAALPVSFGIWPTAGRAFGLSRWQTYELAKRDDFPVRVLRVGQRYRVTRADLLRVLGVSEPAAVEGGDSAA
ncbi:MAG: DNA-binding protein [Pseudonocardia sp.]|nr:DNA-binding protein [Pseudonocardia sp.]